MAPSSLPFRSLEVPNDEDHRNHYCTNWRNPAGDERLCWLGLPGGEPCPGTGAGSQTVRTIHGRVSCSTNGSAGPSPENLLIKSRLSRACVGGLSAIGRNASPFSF